MRVCTCVGMPCGVANGSSPVPVTGQRVIGLAANHHLHGKHLEQVEVSALSKTQRKLVMHHQVSHDLKENLYPI